MLKIKNILQTRFDLLKRIILISSCFLLSLAVYMGITVAYAAWVEPSVAPPSGNTPAPINVSSNTQTIEDSKILNISSGGTGNLSIQGNLRIVGPAVAGNVALETIGGSLKTTGGLIIETRTVAPPSPEPGRIWLLQ